MGWIYVHAALGAAYAILVSYAAESWGRLSLVLLPGLAWVTLQGAGLLCFEDYDQSPEAPVLYAVSTFASVFLATLPNLFLHGTRSANRMLLVAIPSGAIAGALWAPIYFVCYVIMTGKVV